MVLKTLRGIWHATTAEWGERYIEGLHNLENLTDILGQIDGQVEKIQIMQHYIVKALNDNEQKFKELVRM
jgi:hypothetical protein